MSDGWIATLGRLAAAMLTGGSVGSEGPRLPDPIEWPAIEGFGDTTADQISGLACGPERDGRRGCVIVVDEGRRIRFATLEGRRFDLGPEMAILDRTMVDPANGATIEVGEADLEAVARDGDTYWLFGSHSTRRKKISADEDCALQPGRRLVHHFTVEATRELPAFAFDGKRAAPEIRRIDRLPEILARLPELAGVAGTPTCVAAGGLDIEGGAVADGRMMLGLRSPPAVGGEAALAVELDAVALAQGGDPRPRLHRLPLGAGIGIRDLAAVAGGHLILSGASASDDSEKRPARLWFWPMGRAPIGLGVLGGLPKKAKPEGLLVVDETAVGWRVLVVSDGVAGGAPMEYRVARP